MNTVNGAMKSFGDKTASIGQSIEKVGDSMTKGITLPIAGAVGAVTTAAVKWESAFTGVKRPTMRWSILTVKSFILMMI